MRIAKAVTVIAGLLHKGSLEPMLEPYEGKLSRTVLRGGGGAVTLLLYPVSHPFSVM